MVEAEYLIDTNIFLEVLLEQKEQAECLRLLKAIESGTVQAVVTSFSLHSIAVILEKLRGITAYRRFLEILLNFEGLMTYSTTPQDEVEICAISEDKHLSFDDAVQYYVADTFDLKLVSFDADFDRTDLTRKTPSQL